MDELVRFLGRVEIFKDLGGDTLEKIAAACEEKRFPRGMVVYRTGEAPDFFYILKHGAVSHPDVLGGRGSTDGLMRTPGDLFGIAAVVEEMKRRVFTVECLEDTTVCAINGARLREILKMDPSSGYAVMQRFAGLMAKAEGFVPARSGGLSIKSAGKIYDPDGVHVVAVEDCSFEVPPGGSSPARTASSSSRTAPCFPGRPCSTTSPTAR